MNETDDDEIETESPDTQSGARKPDFHELMQIDLDCLNRKLIAIRNVVTHPGEKGRALEHQVIRLLRPILPQEYGLSTGFVAHHTSSGPMLSSQLDVIIYDALRGGPLCSFGGFDVFPLENVYGYVEVKTEITSTGDEAKKKAENSIESCIDKNLILRQMKERRYHALDRTSPVHSSLMTQTWLGIRSYVFAFSTNEKSVTARDPEAFAERMSKYMRSVGSPAHLHAVFVAGKGCFETIPVDEKVAKPEDRWNVRYSTKNPLASFISLLLLGLARFTRPPEYWSPAINEYFPLAEEWNFYPERDAEGFVSSSASWDIPEDFGIHMDVKATGPTGPIL